MQLAFVCREAKSAIRRAIPEVVLLGLPAGHQDQGTMSRICQCLAEGVLVALIFGPVEALAQNFFIDQSSPQVHTSANFIKCSIGAVAHERKVKGRGSSVYHQSRIYQDIATRSTLYQGLHHCSPRLTHDA